MSIPRAFFLMGLIWAASLGGREAGAVVPPPPIIPGSFVYSTSTGAFLTEGSTTNTRTPIVKIAIDGTGGSSIAVSAQNLRHGQGQLFPNTDTMGLWNMETGNPSSTRIDNVATPGLFAILECQGLDLAGNPCVIPVTLSFKGAFGSTGAFTSQETTNYMYVPDPGSSLPGITLQPNDLTLELWVSPDAPPKFGSGRMGIAGKSNDGASSGYFLGIDDGAGNTVNPGQPAFMAAMADGTAHYLFDNQAVIVSTGTGNTWIYLAMTIGTTGQKIGDPPGARVMKLYVNARLAAATDPGSPLGALGTNNFPFFMGALGPDNLNTKDWFKGGIDEVRLTQRALSQDEITANYLSGTVRVSTNSGSTWSYMINPASATVTGADNVPAIDTVTVTGGFQLLDCSTANFVAFIYENVEGDAPQPVAFQVPVASVLASTPVAISTISIGTSSMTWQWNVLPDLCAQQYVVQTTTSNPFVVLSTIPAVSTGPTTFAELNLATNTVYQIGIEGLNNNGLGPLSTSTLVSTLADPPSSSTLVFVSSASIGLSWSANGNPSSTTYLVQYGTAPAAISTITVQATNAVIVGLSTGTVYQIYVTAENHNGVLTTNDVTLTTTTLDAFMASVPGYPYNEPLTLSGIIDSRTFTIFVPAFAFRQNYFLVVKDTQTTNPCGLTDGVSLTVSPPMEPVIPVTISLTYSAAEVASFNPNLLTLSRFDNPTQLCIPLTTQVDVVAQTLTAKLNHFSIIQINQGGAAPLDFSGSRAYPNPLFTNRGGQGYMTFDGLPVGTTVKIYTLRGELIVTAAANNLGQIRWDGTNSAGRIVASGVYLALLKSPGLKDKIMKVVIER